MMRGWLPAAPLQMFLNIGCFGDDRPRRPAPFLESMTTRTPSRHARVQCRPSINVSSLPRRTSLSPALYLTIPSSSTLPSYTVRCTFCIEILLVEADASIASISCEVRRFRCSSEKNAGVAEGRLLGEGFRSVVVGPSKMISPIVWCRRHVC